MNGNISARHELTAAEVSLLNDFNNSLILGCKLRG